MAVNTDPNATVDYLRRVLVSGTMSPSQLQQAVDNAMSEYKQTHPDWEAQDRAARDAEISRVQEDANDLKARRQMAGRSRYDPVSGEPLAGPALAAKNDRVAQQRAANQEEAADLEEDEIEMSEAAGGAKGIRSSNKSRGQQPQSGKGNKVTNPKSHYGRMTDEQLRAEGQTANIEGWETLEREALIDQLQAREDAEENQTDSETQS